MKIGYSVEGSTDRAILKGLAARWCPAAELIQGHFRGSTGESLRREFRKISSELTIKGALLMVFLTDANGRAWRDVQREEREKFPQEHMGHSVHGVADRNVECWICADADWLATRFCCEPSAFRCLDPKDAFEQTLGITRDDRRETQIADLVREAPLKAWLSHPSFEDFYDQIRQQGILRGCTIENLRASEA